jgi:hypothetical protein
MSWNRRGAEEDDEDDESFARRYCVYEEDRLARTGQMHTGLNGPRWFRSENIVPIERARAQRKTQM